jgi:two-component system, chemotaxis family, sensor kinase CheA
MAGDDLTARLRATFVQELEEQVTELNRELLALEQAPQDPEVIRTLFRSAHTVKGAARVAGVPEVEHVCHAMESVFADVREGALKLTGADFSLLFATCDALEEAGARLKRNESLDGSAVQALVPRVEAMAGRTGTARTSLVLPPESAALPHELDAPASAQQQRIPETGSPIDARASDAVENPVVAERASDLVRVRADRLDALLSSVGELMIATGRVVDRSDRADSDARRLDAATGEVANVVRQLRLRPFGEVCEALPRAARDVASAGNKDVELIIEGREVEADRKVIDALRDPLLHLVRNAVDHGIEPPAERERAGKPRTGTVRVAASLAAGRLVVTVADDGAGLDEEAIRSTARSRSRPSRDRSDVADALLAGGISTRAEATQISGRGVGMDIVRAAMERIGGDVDVDWQPGVGTTFTLECPPTPSTLRAVLMRVGTHLFAVPTAHVERLRSVRASALKTAGGRTVLPLGKSPVQVQSLAALLGPPLDVRPIENTITLAIVASGSRRAGIIVDEVLDEDEIVVRPIRAEDGAVPHTAGAAVLPSGRVALVLATPSLLAAAQGAEQRLVQQADTQRARRRVLVADDSITTRTLEQSVLEAAGYTVITAVNGEDAWQALEREGADAVVADVEMPRMDGFALCRRIRASDRFRTVPIVLVTGLASADDRARGLDAGADAYIIKSSFDQATLLDTINQLIGDE